MEDTTTVTESLEEELSCPLCLDIYKDPVSLSCGHTFCQECVLKVISAHQQKPCETYSCPICQVDLLPVPKLQKNFQLCRIVEKFLAALPKEGCWQAKTSASKQEQVLPCDFCLGQPQPAVRSCLTCDASFCQAHLRKHRIKTAQKGHVLVEPRGSPEERKCPKHGKVFSAFCQNDLTCICVTCHITSYHKGHHIISLQEACNQGLARVSRIENMMQMYINTVDKALVSLQRSEEQAQAQENILKDQLSNLFKEIHSQVDHTKVQLLDAIKYNKEEWLSRILRVRHVMEQKRDEAYQTFCELQTVRAQVDDFIFLKAFKVTQDRFKQQDFSIDYMKVLSPAPSMQLNRWTMVNIQRQTQIFVSKITACLQPGHRSEEEEDFPVVSRKRKRLEKLNQETLYDWASKSEAKRRWQSDIDPGMSALAPPLRTYYTNHSDHGSPEQAKYIVRWRERKWRN
ncbi:E3 ubiquitin/ISG15 ligase TRIM25-like [Alligator mississippiensis]|uniref:E3 ubiquitin/ISG15 ligase TRIM25-like n=1 Tax=Alligator mississippiensis TaxID=8496 RepID=UPI002877F2BF|nr:E3 ubiquitin/ISG15 ligase TRIM25-like [Alligator mississippiensis]